MRRSELGNSAIARSKWPIAFPRSLCAAAIRPRPNCTAGSHVDRIREELRGVIEVAASSSASASFSRRR
jgi:hypothetical protein